MSRYDQEPRLNDKAMRRMEEGWELTREAWVLLDLVVAEWSSDPMSVQCFDSRIVARGKIAVLRRRELDKHDLAPMLLL